MIVKFPSLYTITAPGLRLHSVGHSSVPVPKEISSARLIAAEYIGEFMFLCVRTRIFVFMETTFFVLIFCEPPTKANILFLCIGLFSKSRRLNMSLKNLAG